MSWRRLYWQLIQPPERNGLGMAPSEAKKLTLDEAEFLLRSEKDIKASDRIIAKRLRKRSGDTRETKYLVEDYLAKLRRHYRGVES